MPIKLTSLRYAEGRFASVPNARGSTTGGTDVSRDGGSRHPRRKTETETSAGKGAGWVEKDGARSE
jgi:hypothetical protein